MFLKRNPLSPKVLPIMSQYLTDDLKDVFLRLIYEMDYSDRAAAVLRQIQEYVSAKVVQRSFILLYPNLSHTIGLVSLAASKRHASSNAKRHAAKEINLWRHLCNNLTK